LMVLPPGIEPGSTL